MMLKRYAEGRPTTVGEALNYRLEGGGYGYGELETIRDSVCNINSCISNLTAILHTAGVLSDEQILELVGYPWEKAE
jgi:hypothetical protein